MHNLYEALRNYLVGARIEDSQDFRGNVYKVRGFFDSSSGVKVRLTKDHERYSIIKDVPLGYFFMENLKCLNQIFVLMKRIRKEKLLF